MGFRKNLIDWLFIVSAWMLGSFALTASGMFFQGFVLRILEVDLTLVNEEVLSYIDTGFQYIESGLFGFLFGTIFFVIHWISENTNLRLKSFGKIMMIKTLLYILGFFFVFVAIFLILKNVNILPFDQVDEFLKIFKDERFYLAIGTYLLFHSIAINFVLEVSKKYGPGNLWNMFRGKYHHPVQEDRIFMFLDLKDSTTYAEQLGHIKYSQLIQKCFLLLNEIVFRYRAQIYQYVGDEAVLTWDMQNEDAPRNSVKLFFAFQQKIEAHADEFLEEFGMVPAFKAGINEGRVTAAEVGNIKREIAYHGDVLNTGARIQAQCRVLNKPLLVSEAFAKEMEFFPEFQQELIGKVSLKGKAEAINIFAVEETPLIANHSFY